MNVLTTTIHVALHLHCIDDAGSDEEVDALMMVALMTSPGEQVMQAHLDHLSRAHRPLTPSQHERTAQSNPLAILLTPLSTPPSIPSLSLTMSLSLPTAAPNLSSASLPTSPPTLA